MLWLSLLRATKPWSCLVIIIADYCYIVGGSSLIAMFSMCDFSATNAFNACAGMQVHNSIKICVNPENVLHGLWFFCILIQFGNVFLIPRPSDSPYI